MALLLSYIVSDEHKVPLLFMQIPGWILKALWKVTRMTATLEMVLVENGLTFPQCCLRRRMALCRQ